MLSSVQRALIFLAVVLSAAAFTPKILSAGMQNQQRQAPAKEAAAQQASTTQASPQTQGEPPAAQPAAVLRTIVLDPGHGGEDTGARGTSGVAEKTVVLEFANAVASALRNGGFQVVLTRTADADPSLDDRDAIANAQQDAIFISLHVGSTGTVGTVRTYTYLFPSTPPPAPANPSNAGTAIAPQAPPGMLLWSDAQKLFLPQSIKLGDLIQVELAQKFKGSPEMSSSAPVAVLRSVAAPAVAVEISSVSAASSQLDAMSADLAACIARAVAAYKTIYSPEPTP